MIHNYVCRYMQACGCIHYFTVTPCRQIGFTSHALETDKLKLPILYVCKQLYSSVYHIQLASQLASQFNKQLLKLLLQYTCIKLIHSQLQLTIHIRRPLFVEFMFSSGNSQDGVGGSLPLPIIHILAQLQVFKIKLQPNYG